MQEIYSQLSSQDRLNIYVKAKQKLAQRFWATKPTWLKPTCRTAFCAIAIYSISPNHCLALPASLTIAIAIELNIQLLYKPKTINHP